MSTSNIAINTKRTAACRRSDKGGITHDIHLFNDKLREWENFYNYHRPHGGLGGQTPYERLKQRTQTRV